MAAYSGQCCHHFNSLSLSPSGASYLLSQDSSSALRRNPHSGQNVILRAADSRFSRRERGRGGGIEGRRRKA